MAQNTFERNIALSEWLNAVSKKHKAMLYTFSRKSANTFSQWASGRRNMSASAASVVVEAMQVTTEYFIESPKALTRGDLCAACKQCPHFKESQNK